MSRILTGICETDPARRLYKVAVSRGNTFLSAKERFRVQVCFKNAITHPGALLNKSGDGANLLI